MKKLLITILALLSYSGIYAIDTLSVKTEATEAIVFFNGAQVTHKGTLKLTEGKHVVLLKKLPGGLMPQSLQVENIPHCKILSVKHQSESNIVGKKSAEEKALQAQLDSIELHINMSKNQYAVYEQEEKLLLDNSSFSGKDKAASIADLKEAADFYRTRLNDIRQKKLLLAIEIDKLNEQFNDYNIRMNRINTDNERVTSQVMLVVDCEQNINTSFTFSFYLSNAGWTPIYDVRVDDINKPLNIVYNANVFQSTGDDWNNIHLKLSTNNPSLKGNKPELSTWNIADGNPYQPQSNQTVVSGTGTSSIAGRVYDRTSHEPLAFATVVAKKNGQQLGGATTDVDGNYTIKPLPLGYADLTISYVGYEDLTIAQVPLIADQKTLQDMPLNRRAVETKEVVIQAYKVPLLEKGNTTSGATFSREDIQRGSISDLNVRGGRAGVTDYYIDGANIKNKQTINNISNSIKSNVVNLEYDIDIPYSIPSDGKDYLIKINETAVPVLYTYHAVPKIDKGVFLTASIPDWTSLNLLSAKINIYYQGTFTGQSNLNVDQTADTLEVSLGRDRNIVVTRELNKSLNDKKVNGNYFRETVGWDITVKNSKTTSAHILLEDQFPISDRKSIEVENQEWTGASLDPKTGKLIWDLTIPSGEKKTVTAKFSVKYPKSEQIFTD